MRHRPLAGAVLSGVLILQIVNARAADIDATLLTKINVVDAAKPSGAWSSAEVGQSLSVRDRVRTGEDSRASARLSDSSVLRIDELTTIEILPPKDTSGKATLDVKQGATYFFSREKSREVSFQTPAANGAIRGTEFLLTVTAQKRTFLAVLKGEVELFNGHGAVVLKDGEEGEATADSAPSKHLIACTDSAVAYRLLIESKLARNGTLKNASKQDLLAATCAAMKQWRQVASQIVGAAVKARKEFAQEIVRAVMPCAKPSARDCIIAAAIAAAPDQELAIREAAGEAVMQAFLPMGGIGNINPEANVNSPEKPPRTR